MFNIFYKNEEPEEELMVIERNFVQDVYGVRQIVEPYRLLHVHVDFLIFIKNGYTKENTKIEYRKSNGQVEELEGKPAIALKSLYVDEIKIGTHYLVGDNKVWGTAVV